jgi:hypothetical protein
MFLSREDGMFFPNRFRRAEIPELGSEACLRSQDPDMYWKQVNELIVEYSSFPGQVINRVVLLGDRAAEPDFLTIVEKAFSANGQVKKKDYLQKQSDYIFGPARHASRQAIFGMITGFAVCI